MPLNAQEIRHCMSRPRSRRILKEMTSTDAFYQATSIRNHIRINDREMALRFAAFWLMGLEGYVEDAAMDPFLHRATRLLDSVGEVDDDKAARMQADFSKAMTNARLVFGDHAFRK
ncbi:hypothetical protein [Streptomyces olivaceoviridis]|uniref:hypothetical protein n=1 Tax=Streptomyces olivaceoviridis TaxID=1921 RepID=UPI0033245BC9